MSNPLASVICVCYNHARFVREALDSVAGQSYSNLECIVVDDGSTDGSGKLISDYVRSHEAFRFVPLSSNSGLCRSFNVGLGESRGEFIIDFAADDVLVSDRVEKGVRSLTTAGATYGVQFGDAELIGERGEHLGFHSDRFPHADVPQGDIYEQLVQRYFVSSPTMMSRRKVLEALGGYDETLAYEDFDYWIRSARSSKYLYVPEVMIKRRIVSGSMSTLQFRKGSVQQESTYVVCAKIAGLNRSRSEQKALSRRIRYELLHALRRGDWRLASRYFSLDRRNASMKYDR